MTTPFNDERLCRARSALVKITPDEFGRYNFDMICQYTRVGLNNLQSGDLLAVENYKMAEEDKRYYSVLTLTQSIPIHFAAQSKGAYPGHVFESMRTIKEDWESQEEQPHYATTTISFKGVPTGWQFLHETASSDLPALIQDESVPMIGAEMRPLSEDMVDAIINYEMDRAVDSPIRHKRFENIKIILDKKALLTTHFGIFGFTNTGKSNLLSSLINSLVTPSESESSESEGVPNFIIVDPNDEYLGLFIDLFNSRPENLRYIHVGLDSLPSRFIEKLDDDNTQLNDEDIHLFFRQMKLPSELRRDRNIRNFIYQGIRNAATRTKIALPDQNLSSFIGREIFAQMDPKTGPAVRGVISEARDAWMREIDNAPINTNSITDAIDYVDSIGNRVTGALTNLTNQGHVDTAESIIFRTRRALIRLRSRLEEIPDQALISIDTLVGELNSGRGQILIVTGRRDAEVKQFSAVLGNGLYESRRHRGTGEEPFTTIVFDEADLFIPSETGNLDTETIKDMCIVIARRGRKFGLGIGISTQRASMLDTQILGNLHTYFVSKLPRKYDREKVAEAFGIGEEQLSPTFSFRPGDWFVISHDATGLKGVTIPVRADNANDRIRDAAQRLRT